ncbi:MAG: thymidylate synthase [Nanopusillaceae archaeon]
MVNKDILVINEKSNIAISTLWSRKESILLKLPEDVKNKICVIGTTYTSYGVNFVIETLAKYPSIDTLILYGADLSTSGSALYEIFHNKNLEGQKIVLPKDKIIEIIKTVKLIDLREEFKKGNIEKLIEEINKNYKEGVKVRELVDVKIEEKAELNSWPIPISGYFVYETSPFRAWIKILDNIMKFGYIKYSEYDEPQKEYLNIMVTIGLYGREYKIEEQFFEFIDAKEFEKHIEEVLSPYKPEGVEYTYGSRLFSHEVIGNQIEFIIDKLAKSPYTRRAVAITWNHIEDTKSTNPPCIVSVQGIISGDYYNHTVWIRSNDMVKGWPVNIVGQIELAKYIVNRINEKTKTEFKVGTVTTISTSAHIYKHDWDLVKEILTKYSYRMKEFVEDPKGNFLVYHDEDKVTLEHRTPDMSIVDYKISSRNFWEIYNSLKGGSFFTLYDHALYLGKEIKAAFEKLKRGEKYVQDEA